MPTDRLVNVGRSILALQAECDAAFELVINDDVDAAIALGTGVHLGQSDSGVERAQAAGISFGLSASSVQQAVTAVARGARYIGAGPIWPTPSKPDAAPAIGLAGLQLICQAVQTASQQQGRDPVPVVAIGGIDATNARTCLAAGAAGVAVIRAIAQIEAVRQAVTA